MARLLGIFMICVVLAAFATGFTFADFPGPGVQAVTRTLMLVFGAASLALLVIILWQFHNRRRMAKEDE